eukprot:SAG31_NODE_227_length_19818_cov_6.503271_16_plen_940_part_00
MQINVWEQMAAEYPGLLKNVLENGRHIEWAEIDGAEIPLFGKNRVKVLTRTEQQLRDNRARRKREIQERRKAERATKEAEQFSQLKVLVEEAVALVAAKCPDAEICESMKSHITRLQSVGMQVQEVLHALGEPPPINDPREPLAPSDSHKSAVRKLLAQTHVGISDAKARQLRVEIKVGLKSAAALASEHKYDESVAGLTGLLSRLCDGSLSFLSYDYVYDVIEIIGAPNSYINGEFFISERVKNHKPVFVKSGANGQSTAEIWYGSARQKWYVSTKANDDCMCLGHTQLLSDPNEPPRTWRWTVRHQGEWVQADSPAVQTKSLGKRTGEVSDWNLVTVSGAGCAEFNGTYQPDLAKGSMDSVQTWRRRDGDTSCTMNRCTSGTRTQWHLCKEHSGSWYVIESDSARPPSGAYSCGLSGDGPPPTVAQGGQSIMTAHQPRSNLIQAHEASEVLVVKVLEDTRREWIHQELERAHQAVHVGETQRAISTYTDVVQPLIQLLDTSVFTAALRFELTLNLALATLRQIVSRLQEQLGTTEDLDSMAVAADYADALRSVDATLAGAFTLLTENIEHALTAQEARPAGEEPRPDGVLAHRSLARTYGCLHGFSDMLSPPSLVTGVQIRSVAIPPAQELSVRSQLIGTVRDAGLDAALAECQSLADAALKNAVESVDAAIAGLPSAQTPAALDAAAATLLQVDSAKEICVQMVATADADSKSDGVSDAEFGRKKVEWAALVCGAVETCTSSWTVEQFAMPAMECSYKNFAREVATSLRTGADLCLMDHLSEVFETAAASARTAAAEADARRRCAAKQTAAESARAELREKRAAAQTASTALANARSSLRETNGRSKWSDASGRPTVGDTVRLRYPRYADLAALEATVAQMSNDQKVLAEFESAMKKYEEEVKSCENAIEAARADLKSARARLSGHRKPPSFACCR